MERTTTNDPIIDQIDKDFDSYFEELDKIFPKKPIERILGSIDLATLIFTPFR